MAIYSEIKNKKLLVRREEIAVNNLISDLKKLRRCIDDKILTGEEGWRVVACVPSGHGKVKKKARVKKC